MDPIGWQSHRGWGGHLKVHGLEDEAHLRGHLDNLTAHQAQLLVVVQHRVHVLDPHSIHRPVKDQPLPVRALETANIYTQYYMWVLVWYIAKWYSTLKQTKWYIK